MAEPADAKVLITERASMPRDTTAVTPFGMSNVRVVVVPAALRVLIRAARVYLMSLLGFLGIAATGVLPTDPIAPGDAWQKIVVAAGLALYPTAISAIWNVLELLAQVDVKAPELRG